jgi:hypothetical protein
LCAISRKWIVGPIFISETAEKYREIIMQFISLLNECWLQQDGATSHTANSTMEMLKQFSDDRIISKNLWPPLPPDLKPQNYFLWGSEASCILKSTSKLLKIQNKTLRLPYQIFPKKL